MTYTATTYTELTEALDDIANRSFYEDAIIRPALFHRDDSGLIDETTWECARCGEVTGSQDRAVRYIVEDDYSGIEEMFPWSYAGGLDISSESSVFDHSRTHESYEFYDVARHISSNLEEAYRRLLKGEAVGFHYVIAEAACEDPEPCEEDHAAGWALLAYNVD